MDVSDSRKGEDKYLCRRSLIFINRFLKHTPSFFRLISNFVRSFSIAGKLTCFYLTAAYISNLENFQSDSQGCSLNAICDKIQDTQKSRILQNYCPLSFFPKKWGERKKNEEETHQRIYYLILGRCENAVRQEFSVSTVNIGS